MMSIASIAVSIFESGMRFSKSPGARRKQESRISLSRSRPKRISRYRRFESWDLAVFRPGQTGNQLDTNDRHQRISGVKDSAAHISSSILKIQDIYY